VAFWTKLPAAGSVTFLGSSGGDCIHPAWEIAQNASGLRIFDAGGPHSLGTSIPTGVWTHVAVVGSRTSSSVSVHVNGALVGTVQATQFGLAHDPFYIGHVAGCPGGAVMMDEVQILSRALSAAEVAAIGALPPAPTNVVVSDKTSASLTLSWSPVPGAVSYIISKGTAAGNEAFFTHSPASPPSFVAEDLTPNTTYSWTVRAVVGKLFSNPSNEVVDTTGPPPAPPANVTATGQGGVDTAGQSRRATRQ
jgi:hypothetical protein